MLQNKCKDYTDKGKDKEDKMSEQLFTNCKGTEVKKKIFYSRSKSSLIFQRKFLN